MTALISPGARYAFNLQNDAQLVVGVAVPIGLTSDSPDYGLFFYCSFEHPLIRASLPGVGQYSGAFLSEERASLLSATLKR